MARIRSQTEALAQKIGVRGLMNVQFAVKDDEIYVLEVNPRASRTVPFVAKSTGRPIAKVAARIMAGEKLSAFDLSINGGGHISVKEAVFPFARFPGVDLLLGPEMKSTGEVMGIDSDFWPRLRQGTIGRGRGTAARGRGVPLCARPRQRRPHRHCRRINRHGIPPCPRPAARPRRWPQPVSPVEAINKVHEGRPHIVDAIKNGDIQLVVNTTEGAQAIADSYELRRSALEYKIPYFTTIAGSQAMLRAVAALKSGGLAVATLQSYSQSVEGHDV